MVYRMGDGAPNAYGDAAYVDYRKRKERYVRSWLDGLGYVFHTRHESGIMPWGGFYRRRIDPVKKVVKTTVMLPRCVLMLIFKHLQPHDQYICCFVCNEWRKVALCLLKETAYAGMSKAWPAGINVAPILNTSASMRAWLQQQFCAQYSNTQDKMIINSNVSRVDDLVHEIDETIFF